MFVVYLITFDVIQISLTAENFTSINLTSNDSIQKCNWIKIKGIEFICS